MNFIWIYFSRVMLKVLSCCWLFQLRILWIGLKTVEVVELWQKMYCSLRRIQNFWIFQLESQLSPTKTPPPSRIFQTQFKKKLFPKHLNDFFFQCEPPQFFYSCERRPKSSKSILKSESKKLRISEIARLKEWKIEDTSTGLHCGYFTLSEISIWINSIKIRDHLSRCETD